MTTVPLAGWVTEAIALGAGVDVGVVGEHVDAGGGAVLVDGRGVADGDGVSSSTQVTVTETVAGGAAGASV